MDTAVQLATKHGERLTKMEADFTNLTGPHGLCEQHIATLQSLGASVASVAKDLRDHIDTERLAAAGRSKWDRWGTLMVSLLGTPAMLALILFILSRMDAPVVTSAAQALEALGK